jgi:hypothetical protein
MDVADRIAEKESYLSLLKMNYDALLSHGQIKLANQTKEGIDETKKSIELLRKVQFEEAKTSGRPKWWENIWKYSIVSIGTAIVVLIVEKILNVI